MKIEILGTGCPSCSMLATNAEAAARQLGVPYELVKVTQLQDIMKYGVLTTPALVIDGRVKSAGKVPSQAEIASLLATTTTE